MASGKDMLISANGISKRYHRGRETIAALDDVSLAVSRGELVAIVGPSGSGKTTLAHIIGGLDTPQQGNVMVDGRALSTRNDKLLSRYRNQSVGFVFQNFGLVPYYSALENVAMPLAIAGVGGKKRREKAMRYLKIVGLEKQAHQPADELSGGQRQRVSIARALVNQPEIIIADEPTGNLGSKQGSEIMKILEVLAHQQSITILMVTHDNALAARADRIIHINDGKIVQEKMRAGR